MADAKGKPPGSGNKTRTGEAQNSGRVAFDARGNPVWEWETSTGVYDKNVSTQRLKKLQAPDLSLEQTQPVTKNKGLSIEQLDLPGGGKNPYDSGPANRWPAPARQTSPAAQFHPARQQGASPGKPISNSLVSKYAATHKRSAEEKRSEGFWGKLKAKLSRG